MPFLVRFAGDVPHKIAHHTHKVKKKVGALCSSIPRPAEGEFSQKGGWQLVDKLPEGVGLCKNCLRAQIRKKNPLPARVERDLALLAKWDPKAAERQREKMLEKYRLSQK
ncbi:MAG: hypothetical protein AAF490_12720 [Chloroflexota bacterium]